MESQAQGAGNPGTATRVAHYDQGYEIVLRPLLRAETDPVLEGLIRALLRTYNSETARGALDDTFGELQALAAVEARAGSQGKGKGLK
jgi:hypothetical protein